MANDKEEPPDLLEGVPDDGDGFVYWADLPYEARALVYEHLREKVAAARARRAETRLATVIEADGAADVAVGPAEALHAGVEAAFEAALLVLEVSDPYACDECGTIHPPDTAQRAHSRKDLS